MFSPLDVTNLDRLASQCINRVEAHQKKVWISEMEFEDPYKYTSFSRDPIEGGIAPENPQPTSILHVVIVS